MSPPPARTVARPGVPGFACNHCGACCSEHRVPLTDADLERLEQAGIALDQAIEWLAAESVDMEGEPETFVRLREGRRLLVLAHRAFEHRSICVFWHSGGCEVYAHRPASCRTYPFEPDVRSADGRVHLTLHPQAQCDRTTGIRSGECGALGGVGQDDPEERELSAPELQEIHAALARRHEELAAFVTRVAAWNRLQRRRHFAGRRPQTGAEFIQGLRR